MNLKGFAREAVIYALGNIGLRAAALLLTPLYTHYLTVAEFGLWAALQLAVQIMLIPMNMGLREALVRYTKEHSYGDLAGTTTAVVAFTGCMVAAFIVLPLEPLFELILHQSQLHGLLILSGAAAIANVLAMHMMAYYRATNKPLRYLIMGVSGAVGLLMATISFFYFSGPSVHSVLSAYIATYGIVAGCVLIDIWRQVGLGFKWNIVKKTLKFGYPLIFSALGQFTVTGAGTFFISYFSGLEVVAIFSLGYKLASVMTIVVALPFQLAFQPFVFANLHRAEVRMQAGRLFTYLLVVLTFMSFFIVAGAHMILPFIAPPQYAEAFLVVLFLVPAQACLGVHYFAETLLGAVQKTGILAVLNILAATLAITVNVALIPSLDWMGAVIATNAALLMVCAVEMAISIRLFGLARHIEWGRIGAVLILFVTFMATLYALSVFRSALFYGGSALSAIGAAALLLLGPFCRENEQRLVMDSARRVYALFSMRTSRP